jgi:hypothetical protein
MSKKVTKLFKLRTNSDHYIEFQAGLDSFRFEFRWNNIEQKYALTIYKNLVLKVDSYFLVWSLNKLFRHMGLGSLQCVSEEGYIDSEGLYRYKEINKDNIQNSIFRWDYEVI